MRNVVTSRDIANALCVLLNAAQDIGHEVQCVDVPEDGDTFFYVNDGNGMKGVDVRYSIQNKWEVM